MSGIGRAAAAATAVVYAGSDLEGEFDAKGRDRQEISMAAVLIAAFKRVHKRGRLTDKRKTAL